MKEIPISELTKHFDPLTIKPNPAIALACDKNEINGLTIGWASLGILWSKPTMTVYVHKTRYSKHIFDNSDYFSVDYIDSKELLKYFGTVSGKDEDKIKNSNLTVEYLEKTPYFKESKLVVICKKMGQSDFDPNSVDEKVREWYKQDGVHTQYYGEIIKVLIKE